MRANARSIAGLILAGSLASCGQSADVIGPRNDPPPPADDTGWQTDFPACATDRVEAALVPTSLFLAVDRSGSMADPADGRTTGTTTGTLTKWDAATGAFTSFFEDPESASLDVALRLWPTDDGCHQDTCDPIACSDPDVPLGPLSDAAHRQALIDAFAIGTARSGGTPMHAALDGATRWAAARRAEAPDEQVAIVFVTDGEPNGCDEDIASIAGLAAASAASGVPVYTVGIEGVNVDQIQQIATAGGTGSGYFVGSANAEAELLAALDEIQALVVSCRFAFPDDSTGDPLSPDLVRVEYTADGGEVVSVRRVADAEACGADGGWYLDDPADPTAVTLCDGTCDALQGVATLSIEIDVGCECASDDDCDAGDVCSPEGCVPRCDTPDCGGGFTGDGAPIVGQQAVQGGAWRCDAVGGAPAAAGLALLIALSAVRRRREEP